VKRAPVIIADITTRDKKKAPCRTAGGFFQDARSLLAAG
jgi:hypothetical protein